jgi:hypothetical protein
MKIITQIPVRAPDLFRFTPAFCRSVNCPEHVVVGLGRVTPRITCDYVW